MASLDVQLRLLDRLTAVRTPPVAVDPARTLDAVCQAHGLALTEAERQQVVATFVTDPTPRSAVAARPLPATRAELALRRDHLNQRIRTIGPKWTWRSALIGALTAGFGAAALLPASPHAPPAALIGMFGGMVGMMVGMFLSTRIIERLRAERDALPHTFSGPRKPGSTGHWVVS